MLYLIQIQNYDHIKLKNVKNALICYNMFKYAVSLKYNDANAKSSEHYLLYIRI